jgi:hypothetical protein
MNDLLAALAAKHLVPNSNPYPSNKTGEGAARHWSVKVGETQSLWN